MVVKHRAGVLHGNTDALSRLPDGMLPCSSYLPGLKVKDLPCGGCPYCTRADQQWGQFIEEVDDAVPLATGGLTVEAAIEAEDITAKKCVLTTGEDATVEEQENAVFSNLLLDEQEGLRLFRTVWDPGGNRKEDPAGWFHDPVTRIVSKPGYSGEESREPISGEIYSGGNRKEDPAGWLHHPVTRIVSKPGYSGEESREPISGKIYSVSIEGPNGHQDSICISLQRNCACTVRRSYISAGDSLSQN
ncbi:hypothetical protein DPMN_034783 [Dreissena polymorpha]|uniref:Uncharacterized protein n=1 Tax=Dreissena polymorpha TaxID=45954 RepID=A0A9D4M837_DREPO|nr:hypothetical protein DPMN_034783 [Dreissena polymorpha]